MGKNLATTPGSVVHRNAVMELIQYRPMSETVHERPLLFSPPQINKYYVFDLVPDKSVIQFAVKGGLPTFAIAGRTPPPLKATSGSTPMSAPSRRPWM